MSCESLASKADVAALSAKIDTLAAKLQALENTIGGLSTLLNRILDVVSRIPSQIENIKTVLVAAIQASNNTLIAAINSLKDVILGAINALKEVLLELIRGLFGGLQQSVDYTRIENAISSAHKLTRGLILEEIGRSVEYLAGIIRSIKIDYNLIDSIVSKHHAETRAFIVGLFNNLRFPPVDFNEVLNKLDRLESLVNAGIGSILALLNTIWAFLKTFKGNADFDYTRIEKAIVSAHLQTRGIILSSIGDATQYLASLILNLKLAVDYGRLQNMINRAASETQNFINNQSGKGIDYSRIQQMLDESKGFTAGIVSSYGQAILQSIRNIQAVVSGGNSPSDARIQQIYQLLGGDDYPVTVPASLITKEGVPHATQQITTLTQLLTWYVQRFDELLGQWEIPIEVQGLNDKNEVVTQKISLPNLAESFAELFGIMFHISTNSELLVNIATRSLLEEGQIKQQGFKTYMVAEAILEYLGFKHKETSHKMPLTFTPSEDVNDLHTLLQTTEIDVYATEFDDKYNLRGNLTDLLQAAAIIRAVFFKKIDKDNLENSIVDRIKGLSGMKDKISSDDGGDLDSLVKDMQAFLAKYYKDGTKYPTIKKVPNS